MRLYILLIVLLFSIELTAQTDYKKQLDSLLTVHKVCVIENDIRNHRVKMDQLKKQRQGLNAKLAEIQSFKFFRSDAEKEEQLNEINKQIETNGIANTTATVFLTSLINDLVLANEEVKKLQNE
ncbi:MAG TPA: hypothetical protein VNJ50_04395 [Gelidibacter sp.]|uniref:hypothetical protein n=1 Tax=Gelidibacter sp. TaxID=2018083 RepID=UPI002C3B89DC|nr:hypothetical protein [Gelidibacter sp.]HXJ98063.1 hypothetical protein [Gelidibacter sp.]